MSALTYSLAELQNELQEPNLNATRKTIRHLQEHYTFPHELPLAKGKQMRWSRPQVDQWFEDWDQQPEAPQAEAAQSLNLGKHMEEIYATAS